MRNKLFLAGVAIVALIPIITVFNAYYTIDEGNVGIITRQGAAIRVEPAGGHWKTPFIEGYQEIEIRERALVFDPLLASTSEQIAVPVKLSVNWSLDPATVLSTFKQYGGIDQFESRVLQRKIGQAAKDAIGQHSAEDLATKRGQVATTAFEKIEQATADLPIQISMPNIENFELPPEYVSAINSAITARQNVVKAEQELRKQEVEVQAQVQSAKAAAESQKAQADANAYSERVKADAAAYAAEKEAEAILSKGKAQAEAQKLLAAAVTPTLVDYERAKTWNGNVPTWFFGEPSNMPLMFNMGVKP